MTSHELTIRDVRRRQRAAKIIVYLMLTALSIVTLAPLLWMISTSLKPQNEIDLAQPSLLPVHPTLANYHYAFETANFPRYTANSLIYALITTGLVLMLSTSCGYALARLRFRGRTILLVAIIALLLVPWETHLIPNFLVIRYMPLFGGNTILGKGGSGLIDTFGGLVLPGAVTPFGVFLMRQFFVGLPRELEEAARIDGASHLRTFAQIAVPMSGPSLATLGILTFVGTWNAFTWPLVVTSSDSIRTLQLGLQVFRDSSPVQLWGVLMAASFIAVAPLILLFLIGQRYFVASLANTGLKG